MRTWIVVSGALIAAGVAIFLYKVLVLGYPLSVADAPGTWRVDIVVTATGKGSRAVIDIPLPRPSGYQRILTEEVHSDQLRFNIAEGQDGGDRRGRWHGRLDGSAALSYQVTLEATPYGRPVPPNEAAAKYPDSVANYLAPSPAVQQTDPAIIALGKELLLSTKNKTALAHGIFAFVSGEIGSLNSIAPMDAVTVVREGRGNALGRARLFCALARGNGLPCRVMGGIALIDGRADQFIYWNEVYLGGGWVPYDVIGAHAGSLPADRVSLGPVLLVGPSTADSRCRRRCRHARSHSPVRSSRSSCGRSRAHGAGVALEQVGKGPTARRHASQRRELMTRPRALTPQRQQSRREGEHQQRIQCLEPCRWNHSLSADASIHICIRPQRDGVAYLLVCAAKDDDHQHHGKQ